MTDREKIFSRVAHVTEKISGAAAEFGRNGEDITLIAVTKTQSAERVNLAIEAGILHIGENKAQELCEKYPSLICKDRLTIHFIGHLQTNKVKSIIDKVHLIHSVDRLSLAREIDKQSRLLGKVTDVLLEVNIGREQTKSGVFPEDALELCRNISPLENIRVRGLMAIPPAGCTGEETRGYFTRLSKLFIDIGDKKLDNTDMKWLSMGMSGDYEIAVQEGASFVRIGTALFGARSNL